MPFRCLDAQYRRELVRVYLTNVETICRKFVDEKRAALVTLREDSQGFRAFLGSLDPARRRKLAKENGEVVLKVGRAPQSPMHFSSSWHTPCNVGPGLDMWGSRGTQLCILAKSVIIF